MVYFDLKSMLKYSTQQMYERGHTLVCTIDETLAPFLLAGGKPVSGTSVGRANEYIYFS